MLSAAINIVAGNIGDIPWHRVAVSMPNEWYATDSAAAVAEVVLKFQMDNGGWPKNIDYNRDGWQQKLAEIDKAGIGSTIDNHATSLEMRFLGKMYDGRHDERYRDAFIRGLNYLFEAQYDNGGWPQFYPVRDGHSVAYSGCITYNDNAMTNVMHLLADIVADKPDFKALRLDPDLKIAAKESFDKGIECILNTQIMVDGRPTVWCAQHDAVTLQPANARAFELASFSGAESADIVKLLMSVKNPDQRVIDAVTGAVDWFESHRIDNVRYEFFTNAEGRRDSHLVAAPGECVWARFYDLQTGLPMFCDRDGVKRDRLEDVGNERRGGYRWYVDEPRSVIDRYPSWLKKVTHGRKNPKRESSQQ